MPNDAECLRKYAESHDQNAFAEFVRQNLGLVYSAAFRQTGGDAHLAEDIAQVVFVAASRNAAALARHPMVGPWLYRTTRNAAIDAIRSRQRRQAREETVAQMTEILTESDTPLDWDKTSSALDEIVASLGKGDRDAIILRFFSGKTFADIGAQLQVSENAARMRVERALDKMRGRFARKGIVSSSAALGAVLAEQGLMAAPADLAPAVIATALNAPAAGALASALGTIRIAASTKIATGLATAVALGSLATAVYEYHRAEVAELALANASYMATSAKAKAATPSAQLPAAANTASEDASKFFAAYQKLFFNPTLQKQTAIGAEIWLDGKYAILFRDLKLTPDQLAKLKSLLLEKQLVFIDVKAAAYDQGIGPTAAPHDYYKAVAAAENAVDAQIGALLGTEKYGQFQQYCKALPAQNTCGVLRQALNFTPTPLTNDQADRLLPVLIEHGTPYASPESPFFLVANPDLGVIQIDEEGRTQIRKILSPPQFQVLEKRTNQYRQLLQARQQVEHISNYDP